MMQNEYPSSSVLMSLFFKEKPDYLNCSLESLYKQILPPNEIIIVVEGTLSNELNNLLSYWKNRFEISKFIIIDAEEVKGLPACLNKGLEKASGDIIIRFDTDDYCKPERILKQVSYFKENPEISILSSPIDEYDDSLIDYVSTRNVPIGDFEIKKYSKWRNPFNHPSVAFKRVDALHLGCYPIVNSNEDYAFFCSFLVNDYKAANLNDVLVNVRAGKSLALRRSGLKYLRGEIQGIRYMHSIGFYTYLEMYIHIILKSFVRIMPAKVVYIIYSKFLRTK
jgi:glycosyltransferase involved in cell wall biosynthesis